jgi:hypothetical protein
MSYGHEPSLGQRSVQNLQGKSAADCLTFIDGTNKLRSCGNVWCGRGEAILLCGALGCAASGRAASRSSEET